MHEVLIVGSGPAGLTASIYCRMRKLSVLVVDAGRVGGQLVSAYAGKPVRDWPGQTQVVAGDLADRLDTHARRLQGQGGQPRRREPDAHPPAARHEGEYELLSTASSKGAVAANSACAFVRKPARVTMKEFCR